MQRRRFFFETPEKLRTWLKSYRGIWSDQVTETILTLAYQEYYEGSKPESVSWERYFIEVYYQKFIEPIESDFQYIPEDQYYRDQMSFYINLLEELENTKEEDRVEAIVTQIIRNWIPYQFSPDMYGEVHNRQSYVVVD